MTNLNSKIKIAVCGKSGVGKSAVTVRYLTKRFISEYSSISGEFFLLLALSMNHKEVEISSPQIFFTNTM